MAKTICPRCAVPLRRANACGRCGRVVTQLLYAPVLAGPPWPEARRWLDDVAPAPAGRRRHVTALVCVAAAAALLIAALL